MKKEIITIGFDKNGEVDFGVNCSISELSLKQLKEIREMIVVAIWCAEDMWRRNNQPTNQPIINKDMPNKIDEIEQITSFLKIPTDDWVKLQLDIIEIIEKSEKALLTDIKSKIDKEIERWEKVDEESSSYKISALYDLRKKL